ncbi:MAG TPA: branched-chain amino acid ABC transporter permease, partial [Candidatus Limnocylindrales bacterium]|nr:branched-chain amino acid ABC transporter permease [Candidatus Limnocylindrales bacterium]
GPSGGVEVARVRAAPLAWWTPADRLLGRIPAWLVRTALLGIVLAVLPLVPPFDREDILRWLVGAALAGAQAVAFDFTAGYINVVNFGFAAFVGLGGYASTLLAIHLGLSPWLGMVVGAGAAGLVGFLTGALTLRLRGIFAAVMAWFVGLALLGLARNLTEITRGPLGLISPSLFETADNRPYYYTILAMLLVTFVALSAVVRSHIGLAFRAIGQNVEAARASGVDPTRYRVLNFTLSCAFAGWLGGFYAHYYGILTPDVMATSHTVEILAIAYIGGRGSLWGGLLVAFPLIFGVEWARTSFPDLPGLHLILYGLLLILVMIYYPGGVAGLARRVGERLARRRETRAGTG